MKSSEGGARFARFRIDEEQAPWDNDIAVGGYPFVRCDRILQVGTESECSLVADDLREPRDLSLGYSSVKHLADDRAPVTERLVLGRKRRDPLNPGEVVDARDDAAPDTAEEEDVYKRQTGSTAAAW